MASILHHEWADHMRSFWQLGALEVVDLPAYFAEMVRILEAGTASVPIHVLQIPENAPPDELVDVFCRHVAL